MRTMDRDRTLLTVLGVLVLVALAGMALGGGMMGRGTTWGYGGAMHMGGWSWGLGMAVGSLGVLALFGALIAGGFVLFRRASGYDGTGFGANSDDPKAILHRRYAAGEIDQVTYERMKRELEV
jgi:putative membrane protein